MTTTTPDVIDLLVGIEPGSALDGVRAARQQARDNAQLSYLSLFEPAEPGDVTLAERFAVAVFVAGLHRQEKEITFYRQGLEKVGGGALVRPVEGESARGQSQGPVGHYPAGPLSVENTEAPSYKAEAPELGRKLAAALEHAHFLVFHPRDAAPERLQALLDAGWSATGIVVLSQLVAFLSFQLRVVHGLRFLARDMAAR